MVLKTTGLSSRFQICTESQDIGQNVQNFTDLVWRPEFGHILTTRHIKSTRPLGLVFIYPVTCILHHSILRHVIYDII